MQNICSNYLHKLLVFLSFLPYLREVMSKISDVKTAKELAVELVLAVSRLRHSKPARQRDGASDLSVSQLVLLRRIEEAGETTASSLAVNENVSQQAIAQDLAILKREGLVESGMDPKDKRKNPVHVSAAGRIAIDSFLASRTRWLARRIESRMNPAERAELERSIELLERLAHRENQFGEEE